ncbi:MAG: hypothetical protein ACE5HP_09985 [Gemmatimonadota bacterium]
MRIERVGLGLGLLFASVLPVQAQSDTGGGQERSETATVYARETFDYPSTGRRDPFRGLNAGERIGPRFDDLQLTGVLYNPEIASVATLTDQKTRRRYRVREGDVLGEVRILEIRPREVVFLITSYGVSRREVLRVKKDKELQG